MGKSLLLLCSWLISLSPNVYSADSTCYKKVQLQYNQCIMLCEPGNFNCLDFCFTLHGQAIMDCNQNN